MINLLDKFLDRITMYRLALYYLIALLAIALIFSFFGLLPFSAASLLYSILFITLVCWIANTIFGWIFNTPTNIESVYITALILALIITPIKSLQNFQYLAFVGWAAVWSQASKYILAIKKRHIFNPAAFAVAITALFLNQSASWWVGTTYMTAFVLIGGVLVVRKIRRFNLVLSFFVTSLVTILCFSLLKGSSLLNTLQIFILQDKRQFQVQRKMN